MSRQFATPELTALFDRMMGPSERQRPRDMGEVARVLAAIARRAGVERAEMRQEPPEPGRTPEPGGPGPALSERRHGLPPARAERASHGRDRRAQSRAHHCRALAEQRLRTFRGIEMCRTHFGLNWSDERRAFVVMDFQSRDTAPQSTGTRWARAVRCRPATRIGIGDTRMVYERIDDNE